MYRTNVHDKTSVLIAYETNTRYVQLWDQQVPQPLYFSQFKKSPENQSNSSFILGRLHEDDPRVTAWHTLWMRTNLNGGKTVIYHHGDFATHVQ